MKQIFLLSIMTIGLCFTQTACVDMPSSEEIFTDNFDRRAMLEDWADLIIIPSFEIYHDAVLNLDAWEDKFILDSAEDNFNGLRTAYLNAYLAWQKVSMFDIGKAEEIGLRNYTNIYPTNVEVIENNIADGNYNLALPSNFVAQGYPALDYLLYGTGSTAEDIRATLSEANYKTYLTALVNRLVSITEEVKNDWSGSYRGTFVNNDGSSATDSVDKLVNDFLYYYEKFLRAGKIGIPAGIFSGNTMATSCEAPYSKIYSKQLFLEGLKATQDFFLGVGSSTDTIGESLASYLQNRMEETEGPDLAQEIITQWNIAEAMANDLSDSFVDQVIIDNNKMLTTYDELQKATVILKVDMMQALNIQVDYVDADGD